MNLFSVLFIGCILFFSCVIAVYFIIAILNNFKMGQRTRESLTERIKMLRLNKMLEKRKINLMGYLHTVPIHKIENQLRNCESCMNIDECDKELASIKKEDINFSFCPNAESFTELREKIND